MPLFHQPFEHDAIIEQAKFQYCKRVVHRSLQSNSNRVSNCFQFCRVRSNAPLLTLRTSDKLIGAYYVIVRNSAPEPATSFGRIFENREIRDDGVKLKDFLPFVHRNVSRLSSAILRGDTFKQTEEGRRRKSP